MRNEMQILYIKYTEYYWYKSSVDEFMPNNRRGTDYFETQRSSISGDHNTETEIQKRQTVGCLITDQLEFDIHSTFQNEVQPTQYWQSVMY